MSNQFDNGEKSLKRRFLLILGVITFICFCGLGLMIMFWDKIPLAINQSNRYLFGAFIVVYATIRFVRILKKQKDGESV